MTSRNRRHRQDIGIGHDIDLAERDFTAGQRVGCQQRDIEAAAIEHFDRLGGRHLVDIDLDAGKLLGERGDRAGHDDPGDGVEPAHRDDAALAVAELPQPGHRLVDPAQDHLGLADEKFPGVGQLHLIARAREQLGADRVLQLGELLRQRGLGEAELLARLGQRFGMGDGPKYPQLMKRHHGGRTLTPAPPKPRWRPHVNILITVWRRSSVTEPKGFSKFGLWVRSAIGSPDLLLFTASHMNIQNTLWLLEL